MLLVPYATQRARAVQIMAAGLPLEFSPRRVFLTRGF
jgi:hypothetical protein